MAKIKQPSTGASLLASECPHEVSIALLDGVLILISCGLNIPVRRTRTSAVEKYTGEYMQGHRNPARNNSPLPALGYIRLPLSWKGFKNPEQ